MSDSSGVEAFILAAVCEESGNRAMKEKKRICINDIFVPGRSEGAFDTPFQRLRAHAGSISARL
jgi:hypothetical protein